MWLCGCDVLKWAIQVHNRLIAPNENKKVSESEKSNTKNWTTRWKMRKKSNNEMPIMVWVYRCDYECGLYFVVCVRFAAILYQFAKSLYVPTDNLLNFIPFFFIYSVFYEKITKKRTECLSMIYFRSYWHVVLVSFSTSFVRCHLALAPPVLIDLIYTRILNENRKRNKIIL